jgi:hypothetical protein
MCIDSVSPIADCDIASYRGYDLGALLLCIGYCRLPIAISHRIGVKGLGCFKTAYRVSPIADSDIASAGTHMSLICVFYVIAICDLAIALSQ